MNDHSTNRLFVIAASSINEYAMVISVPALKEFDFSIVFAANNAKENAKG